MQSLRMAAMAAVAMDEIPMISLCVSSPTVKSLSVRHTLDGHRESVCVFIAQSAENLRGMHIRNDFLSCSTDRSNGVLGTRKCELISKRTDVICLLIIL